jgi:hypothetical protein
MDQVVFVDAHNKNVDYEHDSTKYSWFKKYTWEQGKALKLIQRKRVPSKRSKIKS